MFNKFPELIPRAYDDKIFFLASEIIHDKNNNSWTIEMIPGNELVALNTKVSQELPTINDIRNSKPEVFEVDGKVHYSGGSLFSSGIILSINDKIVLLLRDEKAPTDPGKWTCPAGRCDDMPERTAMKELYQELAAFNEENAVFFKVPGAGKREENIYKETLLKKCGRNLPLRKVLCKIDDTYSNSIVVIKRGSKIYRCGTFWAAYDDSCNTLELRMVARTNVDTNNIRFEDGEYYNRKVGLFSIEQFKQIPLVQTMIDFADRTEQSAIMRY